MTTQTSNTVNFPTIGKGRGWKDAFVVTSLAIVLGAFVAQIASPPGAIPQAEPIAATESASASRG
jgi:hypothetical protein